MISAEPNQSFSSPRSSISCNAPMPKLSAPKPIQSKRCRCGLALVRQEKHQPGDGQHAERQVDVEHPAPVVDVGQIAAERRAQDRADHDAHAPDRHGRAALLGRVDVQHGRLRQRHQRGAEQPCSRRNITICVQGLRRAAQHRGNGEADEADHEKRLAAEPRGEPADRRGHDRRGDDVGGQHPGDLVRLADRLPCI